MWQSLGILNVFNILTLKQIFRKTFFKKLEYSFLVESTKIKNVSFPYRIAVSKTNVKINRMVSTKSTFHKEECFVSNYVIFLKILFQLKNLFKKSWFDVPTAQISIFILSVSAGLFFHGAFSLWVSLKQKAGPIFAVIVAESNNRSFSIYFINHLFQTSALFKLWQCNV